ncbi:hypothetical protein H072_8289 [Dactylellina haptotyla CBS 200.50]|uniref:Uncharacterized protein n=1 Tax=Dactylellina haptotyla (strain CBS 200.50) TaxID=1284197 RepID=S8A4S0_DACHA|nr:hypothetical protein H072_8289 [Dactylellina haptotyla CBS 200.50]
MPRWTHNEAVRVFTAIPDDDLRKIDTAIQVWKGGATYLRQLMNNGVSFSTHSFQTSVYNCTDKLRGVIYKYENYSDELDRVNNMVLRAMFIDRESGTASWKEAQLKNTLNEIDSNLDIIGDAVTQELYLRNTSYGNARNNVGSGSNTDDLSYRHGIVATRNNTRNTGTTQRDTGHSSSRVRFADPEPTSTHNNEILNDIRNYGDDMPDELKWPPYVSPTDSTSYDVDRYRPSQSTTVVRQDNNQHSHNERRSRDVDTSREEHTSHSHHTRHSHHRHHTHHHHRSRSHSHSSHSDHRGQSRERCVRTREYTSSNPHNFTYRQTSVFEGYTSRNRGRRSGWSNNDWHDSDSS